MTRLAIFAPHFPEYTIEYARHMARFHRVLAIVDAEQLCAEYSGRDPLIDGIEILQTSQFRSPGELVAILGALSHFRPEILHLQEAGGPRRAMFNLAAMLACRNAKTVLTVHDPEPHEGRDETGYRRVRRLNAMVRRRAGVIVLHGAYCADRYRQQHALPRQHLVVSHHGVILAPERHTPPCGSRLRLIFFGRMEAYKGLAVLLEACRILHRKTLDFELLIAGRGPELNRLESAFRELPEVTVRNGFIASSMLVEAIQTAECVVLPYLSATQSGVAAAGFAGHRYIVATATGGLPDVVKHGRNGLLVPPGDAEALANSLIHLATNLRLRQCLLDGARETAKGVLNWGRITQVLNDELARIWAL
jgi:glycosyltransferase involved in cell wall biosynthesis